MNFIGAVIKFKIIVMEGEELIIWENLKNNKNRVYIAKYAKVTLESK